ncbi:PREDICTED: uncharacterized protein LOC105974520 [Erythranthe guttata]|uniref:uncharacterized protein LOC105974520 n=1 Tax=Erythranthe guttata TaxID=4155 RepID=UPI00064DBC31|nr:PREDICTED: uncharacterized protein LOC105974520 [Erythranthe guttata]|eukprot:XP_012855090.1 PREDICTED: uncharacterized protein LOC105974520 [Erythranthe guttata]
MEPPDLPTSSTGQQHSLLAARPSFAAMISAPRSAPPPRLSPVPLANRTSSIVEQAPAVFFSPLEIDQLNKQVDNTLIMKFSAGRPSLQEIRSHINAEWNLAAEPAIGFLDPRHITIHMGSVGDAKLALSRNTNSIKNCMFRLFRWMPEFALGKDSNKVAVWVRFPKLPLPYFNVSSLERIGGALGTVLRADDRTLAFTHTNYARVCIEINVAHTLPEAIFVGSSKDEGWWQRIEYEGNHMYCSHCGLLGHLVGACRKKIGILKHTPDKKKPIVQPTKILRRGEDDPPSDDRTPQNHVHNTRTPVNPSELLVPTDQTTRQDSAAQENTNSTFNNTSEMPHTEVSFEAINVKDVRQNDVIADDVILPENVENSEQHGVNGYSPNKHPVTTAGPREERVLVANKFQALTHDSLALAIIHSDGEQDDEVGVSLSPKSDSEVLLIAKKGATDKKTDSRAYVPHTDRITRSLAKFSTNPTV